MGDDYESLPDNSTFSSHIIAGASAGVLEHILVYPFDSIKTRLQCIKPISGVQINGIVDGLHHIVFKEGFKQTVKGMGAVTVGAGPAHAMYFASYEWVKSTMSSPSFGYLNNFAYACSGGVATALHDAVMTPADAIKQRLQLYKSPYRNSYECLTRVVRHEGIQVLYRAYGTQLMMNLPYHSLYVIVYENIHNVMNPSKSYLPSVHILAASIGAAVASIITNPLDVCKTLLNTQDHCALSEWSDKNKKVTGLRDSFRIVYRYAGLKGFFRGAGARMMYAIPGTAISWATYETFKHYLTKRQTQ